jgi:riboflavin-specific deaminase-like protein
MSPKSKVQSPKLPFVSVNMAVTADGKIATANRAVHSFGSPRDLEHLYQLRATADAVMCGARTVEISQGILGSGGEKFRNQRLKRGLAECNLRVIVSGGGSIDPQAAIFKKRFSPIIVLTTKRASSKRLAQLRALADEVRICGEREVNFPAALRWLRTKWNVKRLLCEGGGELNGALFRAGLVDEIHLTICPKIFGGRTAPTIADGRGFQRLADAVEFKIQSIRQFRGELFTVFSRRKQGVLARLHPKQRRKRAGFA